MPRVPPGGSTLGQDDGDAADAFGKDGIFALLLEQIVLVRVVVAAGNLLLGIGVGLVGGGLAGGAGRSGCSPAWKSPATPPSFETFWPSSDAVTPWPPLAFTPPTPMTVPVMEPAAASVAVPAESTVPLKFCAALMELSCPVAITRPLMFPLARLTVPPMTPESPK